MNVLTFDIEEWALAKAGGYGTQEDYQAYDKYLQKILDDLDERGVKGSFFCTGMMASDFPHIVKLIHDRGHEIGCHSNRHSWMNKMTEKDAKEDTHVAVDALEQCLGEKIFSYRAPAFSIGESNKWIFEILAEIGITTDASIYPAARDFGGFPGFGSKTPCMIEYNGVRLKEFPICTTLFMGKELAYSGGGYFRFFPLSFVKSRMKKAEYAMCYFHIGDLVPEKGGVPSKEEYEAYYKEPGTLKNRYMRYVKTNLGKKGAFEKMTRLINSELFINIEKADKQIDWNNASVIKL